MRRRKHESRNPEPAEHRGGTMKALAYAIALVAILFAPVEDEEKVVLSVWVAFALVALSIDFD